MNVRALVIAIAVALPPVAGAQSTGTPQCPPGSSGPFGVPDPARATQDACQLAQDLFQIMAPQLGISLTGGNATLGQGGTLGGLGHFSVGLRANVVGGTLPQIQQVRLQTTGRVQRQGSAAVPTENQILGLPTAEVGIGVFKGIPLGLTNVGGVDLLLSASYVPKVETDAVTIDVASPLKLGFGARVGLLQESLVVPGVSVTILRRGLPKATITGATADGDTLFVRDLDVQTTAWRLVASKSLLMFGLAAGVGQDRYASSTDVQATVQLRGLPLSQRATSNRVAMAQELTRTNYFVDLSLNLPFTKLVLEVGQVSGGEVTTYNAFSGKAADASRTYGSLGLRIGF